MKKYFIIILLFLKCYSVFSQEVKWTDSRILNYSFSNNKDFYLLILISKDDYLSKRLISNINRNQQLVNLINDKFTPIQIDISSFNLTIILEEEVFHSKPELAYGLSNEDINSLSITDKLDKDVLLSLRNFVNRYYLYQLDFLIAAESYIDLENVVLYRDILEEKAYKEQKPKSDLLYDYFNLANGIPQLIIINKEKKKILNISGYQNTSTIFNDLVQITN